MNEENKDALNNLINSIQEKMGNNVTNSDESNSNISSLLNTLNSSSKSSQSNNSKDEQDTNNPFSSLDPSIFLKIQKVMSALNSNTPQKDLLISLKPFLRKSRQDKMGDYLTILSIISVLESFKNKGSD
ncbi:MAG: hypothetical protein ACI4ON_01790 [Clostridia bacterium]